ncbi:MAG TPA: histidine phosphatase family protein [Micropepsaceae bacterium]
MPDFRDLTLYVIRHGECEHNALGVVAGQNDSPLTEKGRGHARANGVLLKSLAGDLSQFDFFASSLHRTCATMEIVRENAGLPRTGYVADRRLMEIDCGDNTWRRWSDITTDAQKNPVWHRARWDYQHPGGESFHDLYRRVSEFLQTLKRDSIIVTHAGPVRAIRGHYLGLTSDAVLSYETKHAGIMRLSAGTDATYGD